MHRALAVCVCVSAGERERQKSFKEIEMLIFCFVLYACHSWVHMALQWLELNYGFVCVRFSFRNIGVFDPIRSRIMNAINCFYLFAKYIYLYLLKWHRLPFHLLMELLRRFLRLKNVINHETCNSKDTDRSGDRWSAWVEEENEKGTR